MKKTMFGWGGKRSGWIAILVAATSFSLVAPPVLRDADAKTKKKDAEEDEVDPAKPAPVKRTPKFKPKGLKWGMGHEKLYAVYAKVIDRDYVSRYKEVEPGVQTERLEDEIRAKKHAFRMSHIEFKTPPTALDGTAFQGEYTYGNKEAMMRIKRKGKERTLFLIRDKLWKTIDVYPLGKDSKWGPTFESAVERIEKILKQKGRRLYADEEEKEVREVDWADGKVHLRVINFGKKEVAVSFVDMKTEAKLDELRKSEDDEKKKKRGVDDFLR